MTDWIRRSDAIKAVGQTMMARNVPSDTQADIGLVLEHLPGSHDIGVNYIREVVVCAKCAWWNPENYCVHPSTDKIDGKFGCGPDHYCSWGLRWEDGYDD